MRILITTVCIYVTVVVETALANALAIGRVSPDPIGFVAAVLLLVLPAPSGLLAAAVLGLAADLCAPGRIGVGMAAWLLVGYGVLRLNVLTSANRVASRMCVTAAAITAATLIMGGAKWMLGEVALEPAALAVRAPAVGVYTAMCGLPVFIVLSWLRHSRPAAI